VSERWCTSTQGHESKSTLSGWVTGGSMTDLQIQLTSTLLSRTNVWKILKDGVKGVTNKGMPQIKAALENAYSHIPRGKMKNCIEPRAPCATNPSTRRSAGALCLKSRQQSGPARTHVRDGLSHVNHPADTCARLDAREYPCRHMYAARRTLLTLRTDICTQLVARE
jgi:hypothetical protein